MGGQQKESVTTNTSEPWSKQMPFVLEGFDQAKKLWQKEGPSYFPGSTVAGFSPDQEAAFGIVRNQADAGSAGSQGVTQAQNTNTDFLTGKYLNSNPYDDQVFQNIQSKIMPAVQSQAMMAGRQGSQQAGGLAAQELTNAYAPYASQQYGQGLDRMQQAAQMAPGLNEAGYFGADALSRVGDKTQALGQAELGDKISRYNYYQNLDYSKLQDYMKNIGGNWGGTSSTSTPYQQPGLFGQILGGALTGLSLF
jgi:hypothetical protein